jgi:SAM-dependent methyltransferase
VAANLTKAAAKTGDGAFALVQGRAESLPFAAGCFDLIWVRDVLIHIEAVAAALAECRRVVRPGAPVLVFQMFATDWLEPAEAARLWPSLAAVATSADRAAFEAAIDEAGLRIEYRSELSSEWREYLEEHDDGRTSRQLLWVARLLRRPALYQNALGEATYRLELANGLWGVYQMIGKLSPTVYVLR